MSSLDKPLDPAYISKAELRDGGRAVRPRDAATLILVRRDRSVPQLLMGKRAASHAFMPNKYVFPGGKVDRGDSCLRTNSQLQGAVQKRLERGCSATRARALALAAIRETFEETGMILGDPEAPGIRTASEPWRDFLRHGCAPRIDSLHYIARAITPPYRSRRFDSRFFMADAEDLLNLDKPEIEGSGELLEIHWVSVDQARDLELPIITRLILDEVEKRLDGNTCAETDGPFIYFRNGKPVLDRH